MKADMRIKMENNTNKLKLNHLIKLTMKDIMVKLY